MLMIIIYKVYISSFILVIFNGGEFPLSVQVTFCPAYGLLWFVPCAVVVVPVLAKAKHCFDMENVFLNG